VALASILAMQPEVLVLDEPTAGLDPRGRAALIDHMKALQDGLGPTLIVVSHDLDMLARVIQRVIVLQDGHVAADGPVGRVLGDGRKLRGCGLDPTAAVVLLEKLREAGWSVHADRPLPEEAAAEIARAVRQSCEAETGSS
jgi:energy-coupling factor transport system ATP-binding protein